MSVRVLRGRPALWVVALGSFNCARGPARAPGEPLHVAAASDLAFAFADVGEAFTKQTGIRPVFSFGSTGLIAQQLERGAPFDVFAAANASYADEVVRAGACDGKTKTLYARGHLVVWFREGSAVLPPTSLAELADSRFLHIAIANPAHAPYGQAAMQALRHVHVASAVEPKLVFGENVQQALQFAETGNADAAIVALSLATTSTHGASFPVDPSFHAPIDQALVVCNHGKNPGGGQRFADFVASAAGRAIMTRHGFLLPGEAARR